MGVGVKGERGRKRRGIKGGAGGVEQMGKEREREGRRKEHIFTLHHTPYVDA